MNEINWGEQLGEDSRRILAAALADDSAELHRLTRALGVSMRTTLYHAGASMLNALAAADKRHRKLTGIARNASPALQAVLRMTPIDAGQVSEGFRINGVQLLTSYGLMTPSGELTEDGTEVLRLLDLRASVADRALSDEDLDDDIGAELP